MRILPYDEFETCQERGQVTWKSPSNIALVKYWGKKNNQIPLNPSLSFSLKNAYTKTTLKYEKSNSFKCNYLYEGEFSAFEKRVVHYINNISHLLPFLENFEIEINSKNSFPHSTGIASSASFFSSLALCLLTMAEDVSGMKVHNFYQKASYLARLGSGSAARSIFEGFCYWGNYNDLENSSDEFAREISFEGEVWKNLQDSILIVSDSPKEMSSSYGHELMNKSLKKQARINQANQHFSKLLEALKAQDWNNFAQIIESESDSLHEIIEQTFGKSLMLTASKELINKIKRVRKEKSIQMAYTLDAGPNIHLIYPEAEKKRVLDFIENECKEMIVKCHEDCMGTGPEKL